MRVSHQAGNEDNSTQQVIEVTAYLLSHHISKSSELGAFWNGAHTPKSCDLAVTGAAATYPTLTALTCNVLTIPWLQ